MAVGEVDRRKELTEEDLRLVATNHCLTVGRWKNGGSVIHPVCLRLINMESLIPKVKVNRVE